MNTGQRAAEQRTAGAGMHMDRAAEILRQQNRAALDQAPFR
jgi:hypothetical protein